MEVFMNGIINLITRENIISNHEYINDRKVKDYDIIGINDNCY